MMAVRRNVPRRKGVIKRDPPVGHTDNFRDAILLAAYLVDDADSVAATAGQIAGALYGVAGMPPEGWPRSPGRNTSGRWRRGCSKDRHKLSFRVGPGGGTPPGIID